MRLATGPPGRPARALGLLLTLVASGCGGRSQPPDTDAVVLAEGTAGDQGWRLEGRRAGGDPCVSIVLVGVDRPPVGRCGTRRTELRHLDPVAITVSSRLLVFSPLSTRAERVRIDAADGTIRIEPVRSAIGFPARFFLVDIEPNNRPVAVRVFGKGGRAIVT